MNLAWSLGLAAATLLAAEASAQSTKLEARYKVTLAGLPLGAGGWIIDVSGNRYTMEISGRTTGLLSLFASTNAAVSARGTINGGRAVPSTFNLNIQSQRSQDLVRMALASGAVKNLTVEPAPKPADDREPLTDAHTRNVVDPISAGLVPLSGKNGFGPDLCKRSLAVFDGRQRFDLAFSFKRMDTVKSERGYSGPVVVCAVQYTPIAGFYHSRKSTRFMRESRDIEASFAPIAGTPFAAVYRINLPTTVGMAIVQATHFETTGSNRAERASRPDVAER